MPSDGAKKLIGDFSPKLVELTDRVLFDDVWERNELSKRDRSLITAAALIALNRPDQLRFHLGKAVENGVKKEELIEVITHLAFYCRYRKLRPTSNQQDTEWLRNIVTWMNSGRKTPKGSLSFC